MKGGEKGRKEGRRKKEKASKQERKTERKEGRKKGRGKEEKKKTEGMFPDFLQSLEVFLFNILYAYAFYKDLYSLFVKCLRTFAYVKAALKY